jgi:hypothetical protein
MLRAGQYHFCHPRISAEVFPRAYAYAGVKNLYLLEFASGDFASALENMGMLGFRPAEIYNLLAVGVEHPTEQLKSPIVALGSVLSEKGKGSLVSVLEADTKNQRSLVLRERCFSCRFLAVINTFPPYMSYHGFDVEWQKEVERHFGLGIPWGGF